MSNACPYCESALGYYQVQQVKRHARHGWNGRFVKHTDHEIFYEGKTFRCLECNEKVTSFVAGLAREKKSLEILAK